MELAHKIMVNNEPKKKDPDVVPEQAHIIILDRKSAVCMDNNGKYTKHTRYIDMSVHFVTNGKESNIHKTVWCEGDIQLAEIGTNNIREDEFNPRLVYTMVILDN